MKIKVLALCLISLLIIGAAAGNNRIKMNWHTHIGTFASCNDPILHEDVLYIGCAGQAWNEPDSKDGVYAYNAATGEQLWFYRTPNDANGCTYQNEVIYAGDDSGKLTALDAKTGTEKWSVNLRGKIYGKPLVYDNHVYFSFKWLVTRRGF